MQLDHLVFACTSLNDADQFALKTFGVKPTQGGKHELMATHNSLLKLEHPELCYIEFIALDPNPVRPASRPIWFDLEDPSVQRRLAKDGPQLIHYVVRVTSDLHADKTYVEEQLSARLSTVFAEDSRTHPLQYKMNASTRIDLGDIIEGKRTRPDGTILEWKICVRQDGRLERSGRVPTLIAWDDLNRHPSRALPYSGILLSKLIVYDSILKISGLAFAGVEFEETTEGKSFELVCRGSVL